MTEDLKIVALGLVGSVVIVEALLFGWELVQSWQTLSEPYYYFAGFYHFLVEYFFLMGTQAYDMVMTLNVSEYPRINRIARVVVVGCAAGAGYLGFRTLLRWGANQNWLMGISGLLLILPAVLAMGWFATQMMLDWFAAY